MTLLLILASAAMPLARVTMQRQREAELRRSLREMRTAIDKFKDAADMGQIGATDLKAGAEGLSAGSRDAGRRRQRRRRRERPETQVPAAHPDRSDDQLHRLGHAVLSGQARLHFLGRAESSSTSTRIEGHGARRHQIHRLVIDMSRDHGGRRGGLHARGAARGARHHFDSRLDGGRAVPELGPARQRSGAQHEPRPHARRDRPVLCRQRQVPGVARRARQRPLPAQDPRGSVHEILRRPGRPSPRNPIPPILQPSPASTT